MSERSAGLLTISEAARRIGVHPNTLRSWADKGLISHVKLPSGYRRFRPEDIEELRGEMAIEGKDAA
jgi:putative resolvase